VSVWIADVAQVSAAALDEWLAGPLDRGDRERAASIRAPARRAQMIVARTMLRTLLSAMVPVGAADWRFAVGAQGRPRIAAPEGTGLDFNLAHARDLVVVAIARGGAVGVDVERVDRKVDEAGLAARFFSAADARAVADASPAHRRRAFLERWTLREAYTKARGTGLLALARDEVSFEVRTGGPVTGEIRAPGRAESAMWSFATLHPTTEHVAALAFRGDASSARSLVVSLARWDARAFTAERV